MNENFENYEEEYVEDIEDNTENISVSSSDQLDRIEALLNEDIALREAEQLNTSSGSEMETSSGVVSPDYAQYIYDLLMDGSITVQVVEEQQTPILEKHLNDYSANEIIMLTLVFATLVAVFVGMVKISIGNYKK